MQIDLRLVPEPPDASLISDRTVVVIDVLRATSVMVHAMAQGAGEIHPVHTVEEALAKRETFPLGTAVLGGERGSRRIEGFDLGNSPREYVAKIVRGKRLILTTTNGTRAFRAVSRGKEILVASFLNVQAVVRRCLESGRDLFFFPAGDRGQFSLEDTVCAGMIIDRIVSRGKTSFLITDQAQAARFLYQRFQTNLVEALRISDHGKELMDLGFEEDLRYCARTDLIALAPTFRGGVVTIQGEME